MKYTYTAIFTPNETGKGYTCRVPDLPGCISSGKDLPDAIDMITDAMSVWLVVTEDHGDPIPSATPQSELDVSDGTEKSLICVDTNAYRAATDNRVVRKNVSLPAWMAKLAEKKGVNFSRALQDKLNEILSA